MTLKTHLLLALIVWVGFAPYAWAEEKAAPEKTTTKGLREKAEEGDADAQHSLGGMYFIGDGVPEDYEEAVKWFRKAARQGHAGSQYSLGVIYPKADYPALERFNRAMIAAEKGDADAQVIVGAGYEHGISFPHYSNEDQVTAIDINIAHRGVEKDKAVAVKWYLKAAEQGNAKGQRALVRIYLSGFRGVPKNAVIAYKWALINSPQVIASSDEERLESGQGDMMLFALPEHIASSEDKIFLRAIFDLEKRLTPEQRAEGQKLAREFKPVVQK